MHAALRRSGCALVAAMALIALLTTARATASTGIRTASGVLLFYTARGPVTMTIAGVNVICTFDVIGGIGSMNKTPLSPTFTVHGPNSTISNCNGGNSGTIDSGALGEFAFFQGSLPTSITRISGISTWSLTLTGGTLFGTNRCQYTGGYNFTMSGPGTNFTSMSFAAPAISTGNTRCPRSGSVRAGTLSFYANAGLGTSLTAISVTLV